LQPPFKVTKFYFKKEALYWHNLFSPVLDLPGN